MNEVNRIVESIKNSFDGNAWHGPSVLEVLSKIPTERVKARIGNGHSIVEIVSHMITWRGFVIHKIQGDETFEVAEEVNFPNDTLWDTTVHNLTKSQEELLAALATFKEEKLNQLVPNRTYSYYKLLHGIVEHDVYHLGQIVMILKQFRTIPNT